jgi:hypothetical protein
MVCPSMPESQRLSGLVFIHLLGMTENLLSSLVAVISTLLPHPQFLSLYFCCISVQPHFIPNDVIQQMAAAFTIKSCDLSIFSYSSHT